MKIFETVFQLPGDLPYEATKQKEILMDQNKKITQNQRLIKKSIFRWGVFPTSGGFTSCERRMKK